MKNVRNNSESDDLVNDTASRKKTQNNFDMGYAFKQQLTNAWRPKPTLKCAITVYLFIGLVFFALGICLLVFTDRINEKVIRYDNNPACSTLGQQCVLSFSLDDKIPAPVYVYYEIDGFHQNHRRYIKQIPTYQLRGEDLGSGDLSDCDPYIYNANLTVTTAVDGTELDPNAVAIPCGSAARGRFNDTFSLTAASGDKVFDISNKGIAWQTDVDNKFKNIDLSRQWLDMEDERFITWMKISPFSRFRKAWGVMNVSLPAGVYFLTIQNHWNSSIFGGKKSFVLSHTNVFGGRNEFLAYTYIAVGALSILLSIIFIFRKLKRPKGILNKLFKETNHTNNSQMQMSRNF